MESGIYIRISGFFKHLIPYRFIALSFFFNFQKGALNLKLIYYLPKLGMIENKNLCFTKITIKLTS